MKFFRAEIRDKIRVGLISEDRAVLLPERFTDLVEVIQVLPGGLEAAKAALTARDAERVGLDELRLLSPIGRFRRDLLCTGWNYWDHFEEGRGKRNDSVEKRPDAPTFFTKSPDVVIGPTDRSVSRSARGNQSR